jgi:hypothetical protein
VSGGGLERLSVRTPLVAADSLSGAELERARLDGRPVVVKHLRLRDDWVATRPAWLTGEHLWQEGECCRVCGLHDGEVPMVQRCDLTDAESLGRGDNRRIHGAQR